MKYVVTDKRGKWVERIISARPEKMAMTDDFFKAARFERYIAIQIARRDNGLFFIEEKRDPASYLGESTDPFAL
jgi:hypothetical protein